MVTNSVTVRLLAAGDAAALDNVADDVFDDDLDPELVREFLDDPRHHLVVAIDAGLVVGMASGVHYVHPDKPPQMFINEVGVATSHRRRGIGRRLLVELLARARQLGCTEAWVATELDNEPARGLYTAAGGREETAGYTQFTFPLEQ
jgi:aminoglycoside 6'-N-acetyltransferase I